MRILTKKSGIFAATAALLILSAMLVTGCNGIVTGEESYTPPAGKGAVKLNFNKDVARTVMPDGITSASFYSFDIDFLRDDGGTGIPYPNQGVLQANKGLPINLDPGNYDLTVLAYLNSGDTTPAAAFTTGTGYSITITAGSSINYSITLKAIDDETFINAGQGTFKWVIDISSFAASTVTGTIDIEQLGGANYTDTLTLGTDGRFNSSELLNAGYYKVYFKFNFDSEEITFLQIVHIYSSMTSTFNYKLEKNYFKLVSTTITPTSWTYEDWGTDIDIEGDNFGTIADDDEIKLGLGEKEEILINNADEFTLEWYCTFKGTDITGDLVTANAITTTVETDDTLIIERGSIPFDNAGVYFITIIGTDADDIPTSISFRVVIEATDAIEAEYGASITIVEGDTITLSLPSYGTETITITNASSYDSIAWAGEDGASTDISGDLVYSDGGTGVDDTLTISDAVAPFDTAGTYTITVTAKDADGVETTFTFIIEIEP
jgi:hypothetical protein